MCSRGCLWILGKWVRRRPVIDQHLKRKYFIKRGINWLLAPTVPLPLFITHSQKRLFLLPLILSRLIKQKHSQWWVQVTNRWSMSQTKMIHHGREKKKMAEFHRTIYKYIISFRCKCMQMHAKADADLNSPDTRAVNIQIFQVLNHLLFCQLPKKHSTFFFFLINMQMWGNQICVLDWINPRRPFCRCCNHKLQTGVWR